MTTTRIAEMNRLINPVTPPLALECSHHNTPLRGVLAIVNIQPRKFPESVVSSATPGLLCTWQGQ